MAVIIGIIIGIICYILPRKFNKDMYVKYNVINPLKWTNSFAGTIFVFLASIVWFFIVAIIKSIFNLNDDLCYNFLIIPGEIVIVLIATYIASLDVFEVENITGIEKCAGFIFGFTTMLISICGILSIFDTLNDKKKSTIRKSVEVAYYTHAVITIRPDLDDRDIEKLKNKKNLSQTSTTKESSLTKNVENLDNQRTTQTIDPEITVFAKNNEEVFMHISVNYSKEKWNPYKVKNGWLIITDKRLIFYKNPKIKLSKWSEEKKDFELQLSNIQSVEKYKMFLLKITSQNEVYLFAPGPNNINKIINTLKELTKINE